MDKKNLKFIYYLKNNPKPIILSEVTDESIESLENKAKDIFAKKKENSIFILKTKTDILITKNTNISAILITSSDKNFETDKESKPDLKPKDNKIQNNEYLEKLRIS